MLVLAPTRELADQVNDNLKLYAANTPCGSALSTAALTLSRSQTSCAAALKCSPQRPGRLLDHIEGKAVNLSQVQIVILDEADRMLDMGFLPDISRILNHLAEKPGRA